jgi:hypothetical protein
MSALRLNGDLNNLFYVRCKQIYFSQCIFVEIAQGCSLESTNIWNTLKIDMCWWYRVIVYAYTTGIRMFGLN